MVVGLTIQTEKGENDTTVDINEHYDLDAHDFTLLQDFKTMLECFIKLKIEVNKPRLAKVDYDIDINTIDFT